MVQFRWWRGVMSYSVIYVADRENGRVERFDLEGHYLGEWSTFGKTFGLNLFTRSGVARHTATE